MDPVLALVQRINDNKKLRVWSLIITFFGDAVVPRGGAVSARTAQQLLARMGIESGTVRTAFSRLCNDEWVVREKIGRSSYYRLSETGTQPFREATDRIYAPLQADGQATALQQANGWTLSIARSDYPKIRLERNIPKHRAEQLAADDCLIVQGEKVHIPNWLKQANTIAGHADSFCTLMQAFEPIADRQLEPLDALAVRCLLIHEWRRILFQFDSVEPAFWPDNWPEGRCHGFVRQLYHHLLPVSEDWLSQHATAPAGRMDGPQQDLTERFN